MMRILTIEDYGDSLAFGPKLIQVSALSRYTMMMIFTMEDYGDDSDVDSLAFGPKLTPGSALLR